MYDKVKEAADFLLSKIKVVPKVVFILGSGLSSLVSMLEDSITIKTDEIPHWPYPTAPMHKGEITFGKLEGIDVAFQRGRIHYYEGYPMNEVIFPVRVWGQAGVRRYFATNAAGGINRSLIPGDLVLVYDHINFMGNNPLIGPNESRWNVRFPDMTKAYVNSFSALVEKAACCAGVNLSKGVYAAFTGPSYETPAEIRMARTMGADVVGMSTVPEVIAANAMGMEAAVISCVSNYAAGITMQPLTEEEVLDAAKLVSDKLSKIFINTMKELKTHV
jgi:purine-nucleoside phosphorylase